MIAMQYSFVLPADYDMAIIRRRITDKGHLLDDYPGLAFKAYLSADRAGGETTTADNLYAPFYLWLHAEAMHSFLNSEGFANLTQAYGWPSVRTWTPWHSWLGPEARQARFASRNVTAIAPYANLAALRDRETALAQAAQAGGALAVVLGFEPGSWSLVRFALWRDMPAAAPLAQEQRYTVGHVAAPSLATQ